MKNDLSNLLKYLEKEFPSKKAEKWDFVGLSIKTNNSKISKILIALDVNKFVVENAIKNKIDLIISFHPFRFANTWNEVFSYDKSKKNLVKKLKENKINVFSIHTNFEINKLGTQHWLLNKLNLQDKPIKKFKFFSIIEINQKFSKLVENLKKNLGLNFIISNVEEQNFMIKRISFWPGSGDIYEILKVFGKEKNDLIITSDIKWNEQQLLNSEGIKFINISHKIEDVFVDGMEFFLREFSKKEKVDLEIIKNKFDDFLKIY